MRKILLALCCAFFLYMPNADAYATMAGGLFYQIKF